MYIYIRRLGGRLREGREGGNYPFAPRAYLPLPGVHHSTPHRHHIALPRPRVWYITSHHIDATLLCLDLGVANITSQQIDIILSALTSGSAAACTSRPPRAHRPSRKAACRRKCSVRHRPRCCPAHPHARGARRAASSERGGARDEGRARRRGRDVGVSRAACHAPSSGCRRGGWCDAVVATRYLSPPRHFLRTHHPRHVTQQRQTAQRRATAHEPQR